MKELFGFMLLVLACFLALASNSIENDEEKPGAETTCWPLILMLVSIALGCWGMWLLFGE